MCCWYKAELVVSSSHVTIIVLSSSQRKDKIKLNGISGIFVGHIECEFIGGLGPTRWWTKHHALPASQPSVFPYFNLNHWQANQWWLLHWIQKKTRQNGWWWKCFGRSVEPLTNWAVCITWFCLKWRQKSTENQMELRECTNHTTCREIKTVDRFSGKQRRKIKFKLCKKCVTWAGTING